MLTFTAAIPRKTRKTFPGTRIFRIQIGRAVFISAPFVCFSLIVEVDNMQISLIIHGPAVKSELKSGVRGELSPFVRAGAAGFTRKFQITEYNLQ